MPVGYSVQAKVIQSRALSLSFLTVTSRVVFRWDCKIFVLRVSWGGREYQILNLPCKMGDLRFNPSDIRKYQHSEACAFSRKIYRFARGWRGGSADKQRADLQSQPANVDN